MRQSIGWRDGLANRFYKLMRPKPGSFSAGRRQSTPATNPNMFTSKPSSPPTDIPNKPFAENLRPSPALVTKSPLAIKSFPIAVGGSDMSSSGTLRKILATNVFELGPGHTL